MKSYAKRILAWMVFCAILVTILWYVNRVLEPKSLEQDSKWPTTSTFGQFYEMERDSIDVLFFGSSVIVSSMSPQEIYNSTGIRSYNLGSEQQSVFLSYYWLKEALRYQSPKVVVLDTMFLTNEHPEAVLNTTPGLVRKTIDPMHFSSVKWEAIRDICARDTSQSLCSYLFTNLEYHDRWEELSQLDTDLHFEEKAPLKGYSATTDIGVETYDALVLEDSEVLEPMPPVMEEYLEKMVALCQENDIALMLISLPGITMNDGLNNSYEAFAAEHGISYYNLCEKSYYEAIGAELPIENNLYHENLWGSMKTSRYVAKILSEDYGVKPVMDEQWESTKDYYKMVQEDCELKLIHDTESYLAAVSQEPYIVLLTSNTETNDNTLNLVQVMDGGMITLSEISEDIISVENRIPVGDLLYQLSASDYGTEITIRGETYSNTARGIQLLVYNKERQKVVDHVTIYDTSPEKVSR